MSSSSIYFGVSSVSTSAMWTGVSCGSIGPFSLGVLYSNVFPGNSQSWQNGTRPRCAVCNKSVSYCQVILLADPASVKIKVLCHGEEETREVPSDGLNGDAKVPAGYVAFAEKAAALLRAKLPEVQETRTVRLITLEE